MTELVWEDPPSRAHSKGRGPAFTEEAAAIRANPGRWLLLRVTGKKTSLASRVNRKTAYPALWGAEAVERFRDGQYRIYVRWPEEEQ